MASIVTKIVDTYNYVFTDLADPRTNNLFLVSSPWPIITLTGLYLYICTSLGPRYMKNRPPYNLKNVVLVYNLFQVVLSTYMFHEGFAYISSRQFNWSCAPMDYSDDPLAVRASRVAWLYYLSKVTEFLDTIFFVLRKKNNQISFLHVYHHSMMAFCMWFGAKYYAGGHGMVMGTLNAFVHIVMYSYYLIAGLGPQFQKYLWWKKHVTLLQLAQFVVIFIHNFNPLFRECSYPKINNILMCINALLFINLFGKFFIASYLKDKKASALNGTNGVYKNGTITSQYENSTKNGTATNGTTKNGTSANGTYSNGSKHNGNGYETNGVHVNGKHKDD